MKRTSRFANFAASDASFAVAVFPSAAQVFSTKPVTIVVPYLAGGVDAIARPHVEKLAKTRGQPVIVDRPAERI